MKIRAPLISLLLAAATLVGTCEPAFAQSVPRRVDTTLDWKDSVRLATDAPLPANTLTANVISITANGVCADVDGEPLALGNRILIKDEVSGAKDGIFFVLSLGSVSTKCLFARTFDADNSLEVTSGLFVEVEEGTANGGHLFLLSTPNPITLNSTALTFVDPTAGLGGGGGGSGDVVGPSSSVDNAIARFNTTTGKLIQNSAVTIADTTGNISLPALSTVDGRDLSVDGARLDLLAASSTDNAICRFDGTSGGTQNSVVTIADTTGNISLPALSTVDGRDISADGSALDSLLGRSIIAGTGLTGGGDFSASRTLAANFGTSGSQICVGNDARLSDSRAPNGSATGDLAGSYPSPTVSQSRGLRETTGPTTLTMAGVAAGQLLGRSGTTIAGVTIGSGAGTVTAGDDSRLSDSRAPNGSATGDLAGSYPSPTVTLTRGIRETSGPTTLVVGTIGDGEFLKRSGSTIISSAVVSGTGDVVGPGSATDNAIVRFDLTTGKLVQNSAVTIADTTGNISLPALSTVDGRDISADGSALDSLLGRSIIAGTGLTGGGDFSATRTLSADFGTSGTQICVGNDSRLSDSRAPSGSAGGTDISGTYPSSITVTQARGLRETGGPTTLAMTSVADGEVLYRTGSSVDGIAIGTGAGTLAAGNDSRLSDSRAPNGSATGDLAGSYPSPTVSLSRGLRETSGPTTLTMSSIADGEVLFRTGSTVDGIAIGSGAGTLAAGNDSRLSDSRAPSGAAGGTDISGTYPSSITVTQARGIRETSGPTTLVAGTITDGQFLKRVGSTLVSAATGTGDVVGPSSALDTQLVVFDSTTGKLVKASGILASVAGSITLPANQEITSASGALSIHSAGAINIGDATATSIAIGRSGITSTFTGGLAQGTGAVALAPNAASSLATSSGSLTLTSAAAAIWGTAAGALDINTVGANTFTFSTTPAVFFIPSQNTGAFAISDSAVSALGASGTCIGYLCDATGANSSAWGYNSRATAAGATSIGVGGSVSGVNAICVGYSCQATGTSGTTVGYNSSANHGGAIVLGALAASTAANQFIVGGVTNGTNNITSAFIGDGVTNASPIGFTLNASGASGSNVAGAAMTLAGGRGTGTGAPGKVTVQIAPAGTTGSTANTLADSLIVDSGAITQGSTANPITSSKIVQGANSQAIQEQVLTESLTLAAAATSDTTIQIPADALVKWVSIRVTTLITGCATLDYGVAGATTRYGTGLALTSGTTNKGSDSGGTPREYAAATAIRFTCTGGGGSFSAGVVRVTIHYESVTVAAN